MRLIKALRSKPLGQVIIMSPSHALVPFVKLFTNHKVILDAGWSLTESAMLRNNGQRKKNENFKICKNVVHFWWHYTEQSEQTMSFTNRMAFLRDISFLIQKICIK